MIVYAVRTEFTDAGQREAYLAWLGGGHSAAVLAAGALSGEVVAYDDGSVESRYVFPDREAFARYEAGPAVELRADGARRFPPESGARMTRSLGELVLRQP